MYFQLGKWRKGPLGECVVYVRWDAVGVLYVLGHYERSIYQI